MTTYGCMFIPARKKLKTNHTKHSFRSVSFVRFVSLSLAIFVAAPATTAPWSWPLVIRRLRTAKRQGAAMEAATQIEDLEGPNESQTGPDHAPPHASRLTKQNARVFV